MRILIILLLVAQSIFAQKYFTRNGLTEFKASVDAFEPVEAKNHSSSAIITGKRDIAVQIFISAFEFRIALMQEHFNENYMDSDDYPKATFRGKIEDFDINNIDADKKYKVVGNLTIRDSKKQIETFAEISRKNENIIFESMFEIVPKDFNIKIPGIVKKKIAQKIKINLHYELSEKK